MVQTQGYLDVLAIMTFNFCIICDTKLEILQYL